MAVRFTREDNPTLFHQVTLLSTALKVRRQAAWRRTGKASDHPKSLKELAAGTPYSLRTLQSWIAGPDADRPAKDVDPAVVFAAAALPPKWVEPGKVKPPARGAELQRIAERFLTDPVLPRKNNR